jgi:transposase
VASILPENHVFIDECGHEKDYVRPYGRALRGVRVQDTKRGRKFGRTNVVAALCQKTVLAPKCYEHGTNSEFFEDWFEHELLPLLKRGQTVTLDNASFHRKKQLLKILEKTGVNLLFLPTYSPDFNPCERKWANLKSALPDIVPLFDTLQNAILAYLCG